jgi:hypothetical protein
VISQKLIQIFFIHPKQVYLAQRFVAGFVMVIDGTFNTNSLRLPLLIAIGVTNSGKFSTPGPPLSRTWHMRLCNTTGT